MKFEKLCILVDISRHRFQKKGPTWTAFKLRTNLKNLCPLISTKLTNFSNFMWIYIAKFLIVRTLALLFLDLKPHLLHNFANENSTCHLIHIARSLTRHILSQNYLSIRTKFWLAVAILMSETKYFLKFYARR